MYRRNKQARLLTGGLIGALPVTTPGDEHWNDVTLLLDGSTASLTTDASTAGNDPTNSNVTSTTATITGWSEASDVFSFDGSGDYLTLPSNFTPELGTGDFTVECWLNASNTTGTKAIFDCRQASGQKPGWVLYLDGTSLIHSENGGFNLTATSAVTSSTWHHVALVRSSNTTTLFVDGSSVGTVDVTNKSYDFANPLTIGVVSYGESSVGDFAGNLADIRITKGVARYTAAFTPPTASFLTNAPVVGRRGVGTYDTGDEHWNDVTLLLDGSSLTDASTASPTITPSTTSPDAGDTVAPKWGSSLEFTGGFQSANPEYLNITLDQNLGASSEPFTVETWVRPDTITTNSSGIFQLTGSSTLSASSNLSAAAPSVAMAYVSAGGQDKWRLYGPGDSNHTDVYEASAAPTAGTWTHVAAVYNGTDVRFYANGILLFTKTSPSIPAGGFGVCIVGGFYNDDYILDGRLEDFRITKGVARYTAAFTPPTASFPTVLAGTPEATDTLRTRGYIGASPVYAWDNSIEYLIVAGGGGTTASLGGGGGGGGVLSGTATYSAAFTVSVGAGGAAGTSGSPGSVGANGGNSAALGLTATGGGGGTGQSTNYPNGPGGSSGGSGGGGARNNTTGGSGTAGQGNDGGSGTDAGNAYGGGGGGGAGGAGGNASSTVGGAGGAGISSSITGSAVTYAGGGGGGVWQGTAGAGGSGGGGDGGREGGGGLAPVAGTDGLGGGAGGGGTEADNGRSGGSGVVILRMPNHVTLTKISGANSVPTPTAISGSDDHYYEFSTVGDVTVAASSTAPDTGGMVTLYDRYIATLA